MNRHFSVVNKRGVITTSILLFISIILFSLSLSKRLTGGSMIWLIPIIASIIMFILVLLFVIGVITAGIDVKKSKVIFADPSGEGGKKVQFDLSELRTIELHNADGIIQNPETDSLVGARIVFTLKNGKKRVYYPIQITNKQYQKIKVGLTDMSKQSKKTSSTEKKKTQTKAEKKAAVNAKSIKKIKKD